MEQLVKYFKNKKPGPAQSGWQGILKNHTGHIGTLIFNTKNCRNKKIARVPEGPRILQETPSPTPQPTKEPPRQILP